MIMTETYRGYIGKTQPCKAVEKSAILDSSVLSEMINTVHSPEGTLILPLTIEHFRPSTNEYIQVLFSR